MKILLAEDDFASRKFMTKYLSQYGDCEVTVDGEEAVDAFMMALEDEEPYDLVCLDVMMPVLDGKPLAEDEFEGLDESIKKEFEERSALVQEQIFQSNAQR